MRTLFKNLTWVALVVALVAVGMALAGPDPAPPTGAAAPTAQPATQPSTQPARELSLDLGDKATMKLVLVPAGKFTMGGPASEKDSANEGPQHEVTISKPFYMGATEVTQAQYEAIMGKNPGSFKGPQNPVESVSWNDAVEFCKALSKKTGKTVTLPTEAQWEYACRAGSKTRFCYGDDPDNTTIGDYAWYSANSESKTHPVGQKKPNDWGLYDMHGNVWEWCSDWFTDSYAKASNVDPTGPDSGKAPVVRGGGCINNPLYCRSSFRYGMNPDFRDFAIGFRVSVDSGGAGPR